MTVTELGGEIKQLTQEIMKLLGGRHNPDTLSPHQPLIS